MNPERTSSSRRESLNKPKAALLALNSPPNGMAMPGVAGLTGVAEDRFTFGAKASFGKSNRDEALL